MVSPDRPGLLAIIARIFLDLDIELQSAKITTLGERVEDLFYITSKNGQPISDQKLTETLISKIENELDNFVKKASETLSSERKSKQATSIRNHEP